MWKSKRRYWSLEQRERCYAELYVTLIFVLLEDCS